MSTRKWFKVLVVGVFGMVALAAVAFAALPAAYAAGALGSRVTRAANQLVQSVTNQTAAGPVRFGLGMPGAGIGDHHGDGQGVDETYLADALGITVEELQAAKEEALTAALDQAVADGLITQAQADEILLNGGGGRHGFRQLGSKQEYLADALGISVEELEAAKQEAQEAAISDALEAGTITEEQADALRARSAIRAAIEQQEIVAGVLDMTAEELQAAIADGTSMASLIEDAGLTVAEFRTAVNEAHQAAVQELVEDGTITQEQADAVLSGEGFGGGRGFGGGQHGGGRGNCPFGQDGIPQDSESITPTQDA